MWHVYEFTRVRTTGTFKGRPDNPFLSFALLARTVDIVLQMTLSNELD